MVSKQRKVLIVALILLTVPTYLIGAGSNTENLTTSKVEMSNANTVTDFTQLSDEEQSDFRDHVEQDAIITNKNMVDIAEHSHIVYNGTVYKTGIETGYSFSFIHYICAFCLFIYGFGGFIKYSEMTGIDFEFISMRAFVSFMSVVLFSMYIV